ncbi:MAG TPA: hypothetical protein VNV63_06470, partial [Nitrospiria bacterium]|nr:hypothetical protein [Nitrospiria bacterium]
MRRRGINHLRLFSREVNYERFWGRFGCAQSLEVIDRDEKNNQQNYDNWISSNGLLCLNGLSHARGQAQSRPP